MALVKNRLDDEGDDAYMSVIARSETALLCHFSEEVRRGGVDRISVKLPRCGLTINTVVVGRGYGRKPRLVLLHGWGSGLGYFARSIDTLAPHFEMLLVDLPGCGASSRPEFPREKDPVRAERFFLDPLEEWVDEIARMEKWPTIEAMNWVGHSMGGYLVAVLAIKRPELFDNIILASPVGIPEAPKNKLPPQSEPWLKQLIFRTVFLLWERDWTPQVVLRWTPTQVGRYFSYIWIHARFPRWEETEKQKLVDYVYDISASPPSGEYSFNAILEPGAWARLPLCHRVVGDAWRGISRVVFLYGDRDWMHRNHADALVSKINVPVEVHTIPDSGHHIYFDNPLAFAQRVLDGCSISRSL